MPSIGIIGGSGLYHMPGFKEHKEFNIETPFGAPSDNYVVGELEGREIVFLARHARGHRIALPVATPRGQPLVFREWGPDSALIPGRFNTMHTDGAELRPDFLLVPLLAFDRACHRLGYGGGHYDRTLAALPAACAVGFAYAAQEIPALRTESTDRALDAIVTEKEVIKPEPQT